MIKLLEKFIDGKCYRTWHQICAKIRAGEHGHDRLEVLISQAGVDFRGFDGLAAQETLDRPEISGAFERLGGFLTRHEQSPAQFDIS